MKPSQLRSQQSFTPTVTTPSLLRNPHAGFVMSLMLTTLVPTEGAGQDAERAPFALSGERTETEQRETPLAQIVARPQPEPARSVTVAFPITFEIANVEPPVAMFKVPEVS